jgi:hypothetical protein
LDPLLLDPLPPPDPLLLELEPLPLEPLPLDPLLLDPLLPEPLLVLLGTMLKGSVAGSEEQAATAAARAPSAALDPRTYPHHRNMRTSADACATWLRSHTARPSWGDARLPMI